MHRNRWTATTLAASQKHYRQHLSERKPFPVTVRVALLLALIAGVAVASWVVGSYARRRRAAPHQHGMSPPSAGETRRPPAPLLSEDRSEESSEPVLEEHEPSLTTSVRQGAAEAEVAATEEVHVADIPSQEEPGPSLSETRAVEAVKADFDRRMRAIGEIYSHKLREQQRVLLKQGRREAWLRVQEEIEACGADPRSVTNSSLPTVSYDITQLREKFRFAVRRLENDRNARSRTLRQERQAEPISGMPPPDAAAISR